MSQKNQRPKRIVAKIILVLIGFVFGAITAEIALRVGGYSYPEFYSPDQTRGYALRPGVEGWFRKEGEAYIRINSDGLRDREHSTTKPPNTIRIAVLGDSYPEALSVSAEESFCFVMEKRLQECNAFAGKTVEVLNFGVSGYGTAQELLTLREEVWKYSPDVVMLAMTTANDVVDNSRLLKQTNKIPYFVYKDNQLTLDDSFKTSRSFFWRQSAVGSLGRWFEDHSRVVQVINQSLHALKVRKAAREARKSESAKSAAATVTEGQGTQTAEQLSRTSELGVDNLIYLEPGDAKWNEAWRVTEGLLLMMRDEVKNHGARFVVVTLSNGPQVLPKPEWREAFKKRLGINDIFYPDNRLKSLCMREGIPVITLAPEMQQLAEQSNTFLHGFGEDLGNGHWNPAGHHAAGELIAKKLCEEVVSK
jgi:hypothetical protein